MGFIADKIGARVLITIAIGGSGAISLLTEARFSSFHFVISSEQLKTKNSRCKGRSTLLYADSRFSRPLSIWPECAAKVTVGQVVPDQ